MTVILLPSVDPKNDTLFQTLTQELYAFSILDLTFHSQLGHHLFIVELQGEMSVPASGGLLPPPPLKQVLNRRLLLTPMRELIRSTWIILEGFFSLRMSVIFLDDFIFQIRLNGTANITS